MQLNPVASAVVVVFYLITSISVVAIFGFFLYSLNKLNIKLESIEAKVYPLLIKTEEMLTLTNDRIVSFGERTEEILTHGEAVAEDVHEKVERTTITVQRTVNAPIIGLNSVAAGVARGLQTFSRLQRRQGGETEETEESPQSLMLSTVQSHSIDHSAPKAVSTTANSNGAPVAVRTGRGN